MNIDSATIKQFAAFTNFAHEMKFNSRTLGENAVAKLDGQTDANGVTQITANLKDKPYAWGIRAKANKDSNNAVRTLFKDTIDKVIDGINFTNEERDDLVTSMKWDDFNKGKPLTARRIEDVTNHIWFKLRDAINAGDLKVDNRQVSNSEAFFKFMFKNGTLPVAAGVAQNAPAPRLSDNNIINTSNTINTQSRAGTGLVLVNDNPDANEIGTGTKIVRRNKIDDDGTIEE